MENEIERKNTIKHLSKTYFIIKRIFDLLSSSLLLLLISPLFLFLSLLVLITSGTPIFFKDLRVGEDGKDIKVLKFRTMFSDSEIKPEKYLNAEQMQEWKTERKVKNDPRITSLGRFLRKSSLDELPQLINIIFGDMSVVGPRAVTRREIDAYYSSDEQKILLSAIPGLTGYWQVYGRNDVNYENGERKKMELEYFAKRGLCFDFYLIIATVPAVFKHKGI